MHTTPSEPHKNPIKRQESPGKASISHTAELFVITWSVWNILLFKRKRINIPVDLQNWSNFFYCRLNIFADMYTYKYFLFKTRKRMCRIKSMFYTVHMTIDLESLQIGPIVSTLTQLIIDNRCVIKPNEHPAPINLRRVPEEVVSWWTISSRIGMLINRDQITQLFHANWVANFSHDCKSRQKRG